jgi:hypothetical protein
LQYPGKSFRSPEVGKRQINGDASFYLGAPVKKATAERGSNAQRSAGPFFGYFSLDQ